MVIAAHDLGDGGLAVALAEMALAGGVGAQVALPEGMPAHAAAFGEDQGRYLVTVKDADAVLARAEGAGVPARRIGTTGDEALVIDGERVALAALREAHEGWLPGYMAGQ